MLDGVAGSSSPGARQPLRGALLLAALALAAACGGSQASEDGGLAPCPRELVSTVCACGGAAVTTGFCCHGAPEPEGCSAAVATYHVDPSAAAGGDGSLARPFDSWDDVAFAPGGTYLQRRGTTFTGRIRILTSGAPGAWITLGAYGTGDKPVVRAVDQHAILAQSASYVRVQDLRVTTERVSGTSGMHGIVWSRGDRSSNVLIERCDVGPTAGAGMLLTAIDGVVVRGCTLHDGGTARLGESADNLHFENCHDFLAERNASWDCREGSTYDASDSPADPAVGEDFTRGVFRYNVARGETHAAHFKMSGQHERSFVGLHHNVVYGWADNYAFTLQEHLRGVMIGNVVHDHRAAFMIDTDRTDVILANNVAHTVGTAILIGQYGAWPGTSDHNVFFACSQIARDWRGGTTTTFPTLADWRAARGGRADVHSSTADPLFVDAAARDYRLGPGSPAIDAGAAFADPELQYALRPDASDPLLAATERQDGLGAGWEIGAFVYLP
ncbi:MAG TPA: right-handed parallel beta-helix repeat-containing protein [Anaeromyxobacter sp.]|nr:right-handed parallel beta-helix repeat-containing protein [Anaeromyxobacter sp.]